MPITKSAKKALRQTKTRRVANLKRSNKFKSAIKDLKKLAAVKNKDEAQKLLPSVFKALDKAAKTGVIKKNKAARLKSKSSKLIASL